MKNKGIRILSLLLAVISLLGILGFPAAASMGYPMKYTIYYKAGGKKLGQTDGSCDADEITSESRRRPITGMF